MATQKQILLSKLRHRLAERMPLGEIDYQKADVDTAILALDNWLTKAHAQGKIYALIESAVPGVFTNSQKDRVISAWLSFKDEV